jgi:hypothetical protein
MRVDRRVNGFVGDAPLRIMGMHTRQSAGDLLRRPAPVPQPVVDVFEQGGAFDPLVATHAAAAALAVGRRGARGVVSHRRRRYDPIGL